MDEFLKYCFDHLPTLTALVFIVVSVSFIVYKITTKYHHWTNKITTSEHDCKKIDGHIVPRLTTIDTSINTLSSSFDSLLVYLKTKDVNMDVRIIKAFSPLQLTDLGEKILESTGGKIFVDEHKTDLLNKINDKKPNTALDVQNFAPAVITVVSTTELFNHIKNYLFKNPNYKYKDKDEQGNEKDFSIILDMTIVITIMGIYLRNKYLELHPEITQDE